jgi:uncharacterized protein YbcI
MKLTLGQIEAQISEAMIKFEREFMGRGPLEAKTYIIDDIILVRLKHALTKTECQLSKTDKKEGRGRQLIKQVRIELLERGRPMLEALIKDITGQRVKSFHTDLSTHSGERIVIFVLDAPFRLKSSNLNSVSLQN